MKQIEVQGIEVPTADEAIQETHASGCGTAILVGRKYLVVSEAEIKRLEAACIHFACLYDHEGRLVAVPVN